MQDSSAAASAPSVSVLEERVEVVDPTASDLATPPRFGARFGPRNEWLLVAFAGTTNIADAVTRVALPLLALRYTQSPAVVTGVVAVLTLPWLVTALHIGVLVDRMNRRSLMAGAEAARLATVGALLVALLADSLGLTLIFVAAAVLGVADVVAGIAGTSIVPSAVSKDRWQVAIARITGIEYLCNGFVGTPVGGLLVAVGFAVALTAAGGAYLVGALLLLLLVGDFGVRRSSERRSIHQEIGDGLRFLWSSKLLRTMALLITVMAGCWAAWLALIPVYAVGGPLDLSPQQYGVMLTCLGTGGVLGTLIVGRVNKILGRRWSMFVDIVGTFALVGMPAVLPAEQASAWPIAAAALLAGAGGTMWTVNSRVIIQASVPDEILGRFNAASRVVAWGMTPVAALVVGLLAEAFSYRVAFGTFALLCIVLVVPFLRVITPRALGQVERSLAQESSTAIEVASCE
jgi:MFS family permease